MIFPSRKLSRIGGTTLIEILVVIVVFLVGILAIAQIFPGGIKILNRTKNNSVAVALGKSALEALKSRPDLVPEAILPVRFQLNGGVYEPIVDPTMSSNEYSPQTTGIDAAGIVQGTNRPWQLQSGANIFRRVIGETHRIPAPTFLTPNPPTPADRFGSFVLLELGPPDHTNGAQLPGQLMVYGRDMYRRMAKTSADYSGLRDYEYAVGNADSSLAEIAFPANATVSGAFRLSLTATINSGGNLFTRTVTSVPVTIAASGTGYVVVPITTPALGIVNPGENLVNIELNSVRVARLYREVAVGSVWDTNDIFTYEVVNPVIGELLFNPNLYGKYEERAGTTRQPYVARIDYDVRDWRIIHEDFRVSTSSPAGLPKVLKLSIPSIRTNSVHGPDGLSAPSHDSLPSPFMPNQGMEDVYGYSNTNYPGSNTTDMDNILVIDAVTGCQLLESYNGTPTMKVDKTNGYITLFDVDNDDTNGLTQAIGTNGGVVMTNVTGRVLRIYYMGREEWAVQIARNPAHYDFTYGIPGAAQYYIGGTGAIGGNATRIYFPQMDANRKVSIGRIRYMDGGQQKLLEGAEFMIKYRQGDSISPALPSIDLRDIVPTATGFVQDTSDIQSQAYSIDDVRGVSILAKVFYNNAAFALGADPATNLTTGFGNWAKEWNVTTKETYLHRGDAIQ